MPASTQADARIPVTVLTGFLGSGKTTLLNRLLRDPAYREAASEAAVLVNEFGEIGIDHHLVRAAPGNIALVEGGCICCTASGGAADALRDLFMAALRRQSPRFRHVLVETTGLAGASSLMFTLRHDPFLAERYVYRGAIAVADAQHLPRQLDAQPEVAQQLALADVIAFSKADLCSAGEIDAARRAAAGINPGASLCVLPAAGPLPVVLADFQRAARAGASAGLGAWLDGFRPAAARADLHAGISHFVLDLPRPVSRAAFLAGMDRLLARHGDAVLRVKGLVAFDGEAAPGAVHAVHRQRYPVQALEAWPDGLRQGCLVFILRGADPAAVRADACRIVGLPDAGEGI